MNLFSENGHVDCWMSEKQTEKYKLPVDIDGYDIYGVQKLNTGEWYCWYAEQDREQGDNAFGRELDQFFDFVGNDCRFSNQYHCLNEAG